MKRLGRCSGREAALLDFLANSKDAWLGGGALMHECAKVGVDLWSGVDPQRPRQSLRSTEGQGL